jgi:hypothetical protein
VRLLRAGESGQDPLVAGIVPEILGVYNHPGFPKLTITLVLLALALGGWLRFSGLAAKSISHPEMYVPGIPLPDGLSEPAERKSLGRIVSGTFSSDTHPPGYYLIMFPWTRVMGTSLRAIRLPSALFGTASILLIYAIGAITAGPAAGAVAAALLAFHGFPVFWSQVGRMFALDCFLGLAATLLLIWIARGSRFRKLLTLLYIALVLAGVGSHVFFWGLFAIHMVWAFANSLGRRELPDLCRAQLITLIAGSPLIAFAAYQSGNTVADLSGNALVYLAELLSFAFALPSQNSGVFAPSPTPLFSGSALVWAARAVILAIAICLFALGVRRLATEVPPKPLALGSSRRGGAWKLGWIAAGALSTGAILAFIYMTRQLPPEFINPTIKLTKILTVLPAILTAGALLMDRVWGRLPKFGKWSRFLVSERNLIVWLALGPFVLLAALSMFRPILNQRGLLFAAPYVLLVLAAGLISLRKGWIFALTPVIAAICAASLIAYRGMTVDPADYTRFAAGLKSEVQPGDLIFVRKAWYETPILYYLPAERYHLVGKELAAECARHPAARVWVVRLYVFDPEIAVEEALKQYRQVRTVAGPQAEAILYERLD